MTWYSVVDEEAQQRLEAAWEDAPIENLEVLGMLLTTAREQVIAYAPAPDEGADPDDPPERYVYAQLQQAQNLWNAGRTAGDGFVGAEGFSFQPRPLDQTIRRIIRPVDVKPYVL